MAPKARKKGERSILDQIRKPTAPPSRKMGDRKPEERVHPAGRNFKHKQKDPKDVDI